MSTTGPCDHTSTPGALEHDLYEIDDPGDSAVALGVLGRSGEFNLYPTPRTSRGLKVLPFRTRRLGANSRLAVSNTGDHVFLTAEEFAQLIHDPAALSSRLAELKSKFFVATADARGMRRLLASRIATKLAPVFSGPSFSESSRA